MRNGLRNEILARIGIGKCVHHLHPPPNMSTCHYFWPEYLILRAEQTQGPLEWAHVLHCGFGCELGCHLGARLS